MKYKILENGTAVALTRQPKLFCDELQIDFSGAPAGATAIFEVGGDSLYRLLDGGSCFLPADKLDGVIKVTVALLDGSARPRKWICEDLLAEKQKSGGTLIFPNDTNLSQKVADLYIENNALRGKLAVLEEKLEKLEQRVGTLLEGYDLV